MKARLKLVGGVEWSNFGIGVEWSAKLLKLVLFAYAITDEIVGVIVGSLDIADHVRNVM